jgi:hypothetical protein
MPVESTLLRVAHWNLHAEHRALVESLITCDGEEGQTWHSRRDHIVGVLVEMFTQADVIVTTENCHFWWILHQLQCAIPDIQGEFCTSSSPKSDTRLRALHHSYHLLQVAREEDDSLSLDSYSEILMRAYESYQESKGTQQSSNFIEDDQTLLSSLSPSSFYDVVNAWFHLEQCPTTIQALQETLGWASYEDEYVPTHQRPLDRKANDIYMSPDGVGIYWNCAKVKYTATLAHDDAYYMGPIPCNRSGLCGIRFLVLEKDHIVDVFGAQLADGSYQEGEEEPYSDGLTRVRHWMNAYDHLHIDQQIACISHIGFEKEASVDNTTASSEEYPVQLVDPPRLEAVHDDYELVDILPTNQPHTAVCRIRSTDGQLTATTLDRILVRKGRVGILFGESSSSSEDSDTEERHCCEMNTVLEQTTYTPLTFRTIAPHVYSILRKWCTSMDARHALKQTAVYENWTDLMGANFVTNKLTDSLDDVNQSGEVDSIIEALYPNGTCWSDHPPVFMDIPSRETAAMSPSTTECVDFKTRVGMKRKRGCSCSLEGVEWSIGIGLLASIATYVMHTQYMTPMLSMSVLSLESIAAICLMQVCAHYQ